MSAPAKRATAADVRPRALTHCGPALLIALIAASSAATQQARAEPSQAEPGARFAQAMAVADPDCAPFNLVRSARVSGQHVQGRLEVLKDGELSAEGGPSDGPTAARFAAANAELTLDLGTPQRLRYLVVQADAQGSYRVEAALEDSIYRELWVAAPRSDAGSGLRTRHVALPRAVEARYLRIRSVHAGAADAVSELAAYCSAPSPWPPALIERPKPLTWSWVDSDVMIRLKGYGAAFSALVLAAWVLSRRRSGIVQRTCDVLLALCGLFALASFWNLGHFHFDARVHVWEQYHYYIGAKYAPELRYTRLYECTAAADLSDGLRTQVVRRKMRDLALSNQLVGTASIVADPTRCTRHFSAQRWQQFREDVRFFRARFAPAYWDQTQTDHGYNASPVWAILGRPIASFSALGSDTLESIAWIDSALLLAMWLASLWAFGWRATSVALLWWGLNIPAGFAWNGGSFLRFDWLFALLLGVGLLKKRQPFAAGLALTYSTLLRIFPAFIIAALVLKAIAQMADQRCIRVSRAHALFAAGCISAAAILLPASGWASGGFDAWPQFIENSQKHLRTALMNNMGLKTALGFDPQTTAQRLQRPDDAEPLAHWKRVRADFNQRRAALLATLVAAFCLMLARAGQREPDWVVACLGAGLIVFATELTCYYYGFLLLYGLLWNRSRVPGFATAALAALSSLLALRLPWHDEQFTALSLATVLVVLLSTAWIAFGPAPRDTRQADG